MKLGQSDTPIIALAADTEENIAKMQAKVSNNITVLRDKDLVLAGPLHNRDEGGNPVGGDVFRTAHVLVDKTGKVITADFGKNYRVR